MSASVTGQPSKAVPEETTSRVVPGRRVDDRPVEPEQGVEQPALPHVRPARQDDPPAADETDPDLGPGDQGIEPVAGRPRGRHRPPERSGPARGRGPRRPGRAGGRRSGGSWRGAGRAGPRPGAATRPSGGPRPRPGPAPRPPGRGPPSTISIAAGPPWPWISTSAGSPGRTIATTSSPRPAPTRPSRGRPGGRRRQARPAMRAGRPRRRRPARPSPQTRTTATAPGPSPVRTATRGGRMAQPPQAARRPSRTSDGASRTSGRSRAVGPIRSAASPPDQTTQGRGESPSAWPVDEGPDRADGRPEDAGLERGDGRASPGRRAADRDGPAGAASTSRAGPRPRAGTPGRSPRPARRPRPRSARR